MFLDILKSSSKHEIRMINVEVVCDTSGNQGGPMKTHPRNMPLKVSLSTSGWGEGEMIILDHN